MHSEFAVCGARVAWRYDQLSLERLARQVLRAPVPFNAVELHGSRISLKTQPDPRPGESNPLLDPSDWIHAVTLLVPDPQRLASRVAGPGDGRISVATERCIGIPLGQLGPSAAPEPGSEPLHRGRCGVEVKIVAVITEHKVKDAILRSMSRGMYLDPLWSWPPVAGVGGTATIQ